MALRVGPAPHTSLFFFPFFFFFFFNTKQQKVLQCLKFPFLLSAQSSSIPTVVLKDLYAFSLLEGDVILMKHILRLTGSISLASSFFPYLQDGKRDTSSSSIWGDCNSIFGPVQGCFLSCINVSEVCALCSLFQKHQLVLIKGTSYLWGHDLP